MEKILIFVFFVEVSEDQNINAIPEAERIQQLEKLNAIVDEAVVASDSEENLASHKDSVENNQINGLDNTDKQTETKNGSRSSNKNTDSSSQNESDKTLKNEVPSEIVEGIVDDISEGVVKDFSKNIATYITEVCKFDEQYEKCQKNSTSDNNESVSSVSETLKTENTPEPETLNIQHTEVTNGPEETADQPRNTGGTEQPFNPEEVKENDVKDECFGKEEMKYSKEDNSEKKEEEDDDGYMDLLGNALLKRKVLDGIDMEDVTPFHGDIVTVNTSGTLEDGTKVDQFSDLTFPVGEGDVIQAWDLGVMTTKVGQTIELITDAKYAYGDIGREPDIPPKANITYTIKLIKKETPPDLNKLDVNQRQEMAEKKRERGNELFARNDYAGAINSYNRAIKIIESGTLDGSPEKLQSLSDCRLKCCNNMAACQLKVEAYDAAIKSCESVLTLQPENVKALFRMGKAHTARGHTKVGIQYLQKASKLEPDSKVIKQELKKLSQKLSKETELEKDMYRKMLGTKASQPIASQSQQKSWKWTLLGGVVAALVAVGVTAYRYGHH